LEQLTHSEWAFKIYFGLDESDKTWDPRAAPATWPFGVSHFRGVTNGVLDAAEREFRLFRRELPPSRSIPLIPPTLTADHLQDSDHLRTALPEGQSDNTPIEQRLARFVTMLVHLPNERNQLLRLVDDAIGDRRNISAVRTAIERSINDPRQGRIIEEVVFLFAPFWLREPRTAEGTDARGMLRHTFVRDAVPESIDWPSDLKWFCWFILLAQGGSLAHAAPLLGWRTPGRFQHHLVNLNLPGRVSPIEACCVAELKRLGGDDRDIRRFFHTEAFLIDPSEESADPSYLPFWQATARWMIAHRNEISDDEADAILHWAMHEYTEGVRAGGAAFSWKGRGVRPTLARSLEYTRHLARPWLFYRWRGHGWDLVDETTTAGTWSFVELTSGEDLFLEGMALHHCVAGYAGRCAAGCSAIVSMRRDGERIVTIEVVPETGRIVQARGACNRAATSVERQAIDRWAESVFGRSR